MYPFKLEIHVEPQSRDDHRSTVSVVAGMGDALHVRTGEDATPQVRRVVALRDVLSPVVQGAVAQQEALPAKPQVGLMVG